MSNEKPGAYPDAPTPDALLKSSPNASIELTETDLDDVSGGRGGGVKTEPQTIGKLEPWK